MERKSIKTAQEAANVNSFASIAALLIERWKVGKTPRHVDSVRRRIAADILPALGPRRGTHVTRLAIKMLGLTFVRTSELIEAKWSEFDLEASRRDIPAERMKMRAPHVVSFSKQTLETSEALRPLSGGSEWLFPGNRDRSRPMSNNTLLKGLERMGYKGKKTGHGFRGLASTVLHEQGPRHDPIELQLAQAPRDVSASYFTHCIFRHVPR